MFFIFLRFSHYSCSVSSPTSLYKRDIRNQSLFRVCIDSDTMMAWLGCNGCKGEEVNESNYYNFQLERSTTVGSWSEETTEKFPPESSRLHCIYFSKSSHSLTHTETKRSVVYFNLNEKGKINSLLKCI